MSQDRQALKRRIKRIKLTPFLDALPKLLPGLDIPARVPRFVCCPLPAHDEKTPSCLLHPDRWHCFGCGQGGDLMDLAQHLYGVDLARAVGIVEQRLGLALGDDADLAALTTIARQQPIVEPPPDPLAWEEDVGEVERLFLDLVRVYLRCGDPDVQDAARASADAVFSIFDKIRDDVPSTARGARERLRSLGAWAEEHAAGVADDVRRVTGKDLLACALQGPDRDRPSLGARLAELVVVRGLLGRLRYHKQGRSRPPRGS